MVEETSTPTSPISNETAVAVVEALAEGNDGVVTRRGVRVTDVHIAHIQHIMAETPTAEAVLADAMRPESPLHELYDWDDARMAYKYRLAQTRVMIRLV